MREAKSTGEGSLSLLQKIFPTEKLTWVLHCTQIFYQLSYQEVHYSIQLLSFSAIDIFFLSEIVNEQFNMIFFSLEINQILGILMAANSLPSSPCPFNDSSYENMSLFTAMGSVIYLSKMSMYFFFENGKYFQL